MTEDTLHVRQPTIEEGRVTRGAAWLDENYPGWVDRIDLGALDMANECWCVVGQANPNGDYYQAMDDQWLDEWHLGFTLLFGDDWGLLTEAWKTEIRRRRQQSNR